MAHEPTTLLGVPSRRKITDPGPIYPDAVRLASLRRQRQQELTRYGEGPAAERELGSLQREQAEDPYTGELEQERQRGFQTLADFFRPDVARQRQAEQEFALRAAGEPARVAGGFSVEAAKQSQLGREAHDIRLSQARADLEEQRQAGLVSRLGQGSAQTALRQRLQALQTGKAHAIRPSGGGPLSGWFGIGPSQKELDDAEIAQILSQLGTGEDVRQPSDLTTGPTIGTRRVIRGQLAEWDGQGWIAITQ